jgi:large subunit ribosomal protein L7Ae
MGVLCAHNGHGGRGGWTPGVVCFPAHLLRPCAATEIFKMLNKYRPETKEQKEERLKEAGATKAAGGAAPQGKKPMFVKCGINHIATLVEQKKATMVCIAHDVDPIEVVVWLPALCRKMDVPYCIVKGKARLGQVVHKKNATALAFTGVRKEVCPTTNLALQASLACFVAPVRARLLVGHCCSRRGWAKKKRDPDLRAARLQDEGAFSKLVDNVRSNFNDNADLGRRWGGGIMGEKSQERTRQKERAVAREAAKRMQV